MIDDRFPQGRNRTKTEGDSTVDTHPHEGIAVISWCLSFGEKQRP